MTKVELTQESFLENLDEIKKQIFYDRTLALNRYQKQDDNLESDEQFVLMAKGMVDLLKIATNRTDQFFAVARLQASIIFKDANIGSSSSLTDDDIKREIQRQVSEQDDVSDANNNDPKNK